MRVLDLFSGIGGFSLGLQRAGMQTVAFCEIDPFCRRVLEKRFPGVPIWDDVRTLSFKADGICQCEQKNKCKPAEKTLKKPMKNEKQGSLFDVANAAEVLSRCQLALPSVGGDFALGNAEQNRCAETKDRTLAVVNGCADQITPIGKTAKETKELNTIEVMQSEDGEGAFSQEIIIPVSSADCRPRNKGNCAPIISNAGWTTPNEDLMLLMESLSARNVTKKCTECGGVKIEIDVIAAGVPCQPASVAGKRRGKDDDRWLWPEAIRIVREVIPKWVILENVGGLITLDNGMALDNVLSDLENLSYACQTFNIPACAVDAPHQRKRVWIVAHSGSDGLRESEIC